MIKTHKPRGYIWSHASAFQQTPEFRNIHYEDSLPPPTSILVRDQDDHLSRSERAAKRRRIEALANDFMDGRPLFISSARSYTQSLKVAILNDNKSPTELKDVLAFESRAAEPTQAWEDVEDDGELLERLHRRQRIVRPYPEKENGHVSPDRVVQITVTQQAQSSCEAKRVPKVSRFTTGPSEEALKKAAELRARRLQRANSEIPPVTRQSPHLEQRSRCTAEPRSEPCFGDGEELRTIRESRVWLSRRKSRFQFDALDAEDSSADELRLSRVETPLASSARPQSSTLADMSECDGSSPSRMHNEDEDEGEAFGGACSLDLEDRGTPEPVLAETLDAYYTSIGEKATVERSLSNDKSGSHDDPCGQQASYHTAPEETQTALGEDPSCDTSLSQENSQARLLRKQGILAKPLKSWTAMNQHQSTKQNNPIPRRGQTTPDTGESINSIRHLLQESAKLNAGKSKHGKSRNSSSKNTPKANSASRRPRTAPTTATPEDIDTNVPIDQQRYMGAFQVNINQAAKASIDGKTPFKFWKRGKAGASAQDQAKERRRETYPSSRNTKEGGNPAEEVPPQPVTGNPPLLDISFDHDSSFAPKLNMALVDQHLNRLLPRSPNATETPSAVKKALRRELRRSRAEMSRCASEPPGSSQVEEHQQVESAQLSPSVAEQIDSQTLDKQGAPSQLWPGTQAMLDKAQRELITSPEKQNVDETGHHEATSSADDLSPAQLDATDIGQEDGFLREPMPSTQAMLGQFNGWSTVKKRRDVLETAEQKTPSAAPKITSYLDISTNLMTTPSILSNATADGGDDSRLCSSRRSTKQSTDPSLRRVVGQKSLHVHDSELNSKEELFTSGVAMSGPKSRLQTERSTSTQGSKDSEASLQPAWDTGKRGTFGHDATDLPFSSFQAAQPRSELLRDASDVSRNVDDLTESVLNVQDMEGVFTQVV